MDEESLGTNFHGFPSDSFTPCRLEIETKGTGEEEQLVSVWRRRSTGQEVALQTKSPWLKNVQTFPSEVVTLVSGDGVSVSIPEPFLAASSDFLQSLLFSHRTTNTIILPSSSGFALKLFSQLLLGGGTDQIDGDDIESCMESVKDVFDLLGCKVELVTRVCCGKNQGQDLDARNLGVDSCLFNKNLEVTVTILKGDESKDITNFLKEDEEAGKIKLSLFSSTIKKEEVHDEQDSSNGLGLKEEVEIEEDIEYFEYGDSENVIKLEEQHHFDNLSPGEADPKIEIKVDIVKAETDCNDLQAGQSSPVSYKYHYSPHIKNRIGNSAWNDVKHSWMLKTLSSKNCSSHVLLPQITVSSSSITPPDEGLFEDLDIAGKGKNSNSLYFHVDHIDDIIQENIKEVSAPRLSPGPSSLPANIAREVKQQLSAKLQPILLEDAKNDSFPTPIVNPCQVMMRRLSQVDEYMGGLNEKQNHAEDNDEHTGPASTIALVSPHHINLSLFQKGFYGSYHCLREGCIYVCGTYGASTQKLLLNHWTKEHGDVRLLLYLDMSTFTIIGLKIIYNHVGSCSYVGCTCMLYGDTVDKFQASIVEHWHTSHPTMDNSYHPRMCQVISQEDIPVLTDQVAADLIRKQGVLNGFSTGYRVSNSWLQDSVEYPFTCSAPGCGELIKSMYGRHFSKLHSELPLDKIRVTTMDGEIFRLLF